MGAGGLGPADARLLGARSWATTASWPRSTRPQFKAAVEQAKSASQAGAEFKTDFDAAKGEWKTKYDEGKSLVVDTADRGMWPEFLKTISEHLPDPVRDYKLDPNNPTDQHKLDKLRVHIDAIKPVWRTDVAAEWFDAALERRRSRT